MNEEDIDEYVENEYKRIRERINESISIKPINQKYINEIECQFSIENFEKAQKKQEEHLKSKIRKKYIRETLDGTHEYSVSNKLKQAIKQSPYNQKEVAQKIGINARTLSNIVNGKYNTSLEVALKLSYLLNIKVDDLFDLQIIDKNNDK